MGTTRRDFLRAGASVAGLAAGLAAVGTDRVAPDAAHGEAPTAMATPPTERQGDMLYRSLGRTGERVWRSEISSIDTTLLLGGILTSRQYFHDDQEIVRLATKIYERVDFQWMLNGDAHLAARRTPRRNRSTSRSSDCRRTVSICCSITR